MKRNRIEGGRFTKNAHGLGTVTEEMVRQRAREIAIINGRAPEQASDADLEQARRELTGQERLNPSPTKAETLPEDQHWNVVAESEGGRVDATPAPDERTLAEKLVEEGVEDAEHERMVQATRESLRRDNP